MSDETIADITFLLSTPVVPWEGDPDEFIREIKGTIQVYNCKNEEPELAGNIGLFLVHKSESESEGQSLWEICECHSSVLEAVYTAFFDMEGDFRKELKIEAGFRELLYLDYINIEERFANMRVRVIRTAIAIFGSQSVIIAHHELLSVNEWRELGFVRVAGQLFVFCDPWKKNPYQKEQE